MSKKKQTQPVKDPRQIDLEDWLKEKLTPKLAWFELCKLRAEGNKLHAEGDKLWAQGDKLRAESDEMRAEGSKLRAEGSKLHAEGDKLWAEGDKLQAEGNKLYAEGRLIFSQAVIDHHGPKTTMDWTPAGCRAADREYNYGEPI
jgi:cytochrome c556